MEFTIMKVTTFKNGKKFANIIGMYDTKKKLTDMIIKDFHSDDVEANIKDITRLSSDLYNYSMDNDDIELEYHWNNDDILITFHISRLSI